MDQGDRGPQLAKNGLVHKLQKASENNSDRIQIECIVVYLPVSPKPYLQWKSGRLKSGEQLHYLVLLHASRSNVA